MTYDELLRELTGAAEEDFIAFQKKILCTQKNIIGVRTPILRKIAKKYRGRYAEFKHFPDESYEVCFLKLCLAETLPFAELLSELDYLISVMDCWALTDTFKPKAIAKNKEAYLSVIRKQMSDGREFFERFALVTLLWCYREKEDLPLVFECASSADNEKYYYVHTASAWLIAETLVRYFDAGVAFLKEGRLPIQTHNKAIQKARESYRITAEQKEYLKNLKRY